ncbi:MULTISPECIES: LytTR family DNA-binding domain-containing protein [Hyphobacterium]|uniref:LytTR family DNA-binding domain-containing protein n=1 Tax=Hyphobacterium vulgare TaxID=1736751 RepID=A0ABV6ZVQ1_9PROT
MTWTERVKQLLPGAGFILGVGTFLAFLAPYQTHHLGWPLVWFYWTGLIAWGALCGEIGGRLLQRFVPGWPDWISYPLISLAISVPVTAAVLTLQALLGDPHPLDGWPVVLFFVWVVSAGITFLTWLIDRTKRTGQTAEPVIARTLTDKLPVRLRTAELHALQSEDHYLRVHTSAGDALILMRLSDAIAAASALEGEQTHRSWWVARSAITDARRDGSQAVLTLKGGIEAPVSRANVPKLREKGWL